MRNLFGCWGVGALVALFGSFAVADDAALSLTLRSRVESPADSKQYRPVVQSETWKPSETAIIVCDMWDSHHSQNAARRTGEVAPRMNEVLKAARNRGVFIIHSPSDTMSFYEDHPGRKRAMDAPTAANLPDKIQQWCRQIPSEEKGVYPIDQSDGGEDDDRDALAEWHKELKADGRDPKRPWKRQIATLEIDEAKDAISDKGVEVWNLLEARGIKNVILMGVHTNMCVLGRPFGLRQMAQNGKHVVLMRDLTDTMYNPARSPFVNHFSGTDLIIEHIEKFVCPTITSDQILGGKPFRFAGDKRPRLLIVIAEDEYQTAKSLPEFATPRLYKHFAVNYVYANPENRNDLSGIEKLADSDVVLFSIRRRTPPKAQLDAVRKYLASGKPLVAIRTSSHAFALREGKPADDLDQWPHFDKEILGGNYHNHHGSKGPKTMVRVVAEAKDHPILQGIPREEFQVFGTLYKSEPLEAKATALLMGRIGEVQPQEPVAWTNLTPAGGRVFYTSLGHIEDFKLPAFQRLLSNGLYWAAGLEIPQDQPLAQAQPATAPK